MLTMQTSSELERPASSKCLFKCAERHIAAAAEVAAGSALAAGAAAGAANAALANKEFSTEEIQAADKPSKKELLAAQKSSKKMLKCASFLPTFILQVPYTLSLLMSL